MMDVDRDILINRVVDDEATSADWAALKALAARDATIWRDLAEAQHAHAELCAAVEETVAVVDAVEAPVDDVMRWRFSARVRTAATWGGWAAAAAVALAWVGGVDRSGADAQDVNSAGMLPVGASLTAADALQKYLDLGRESGDVVGLMPEVVLVDSAPNPAGSGYEVVFIRQIMERRVVEDFYRLGADELGRPVPVRMDVVRRAKDPM